MPSFSRFSAALFVACALSVAASAQQATFRSGTRVVSLFTTVADMQGRLVPDLTKEDFEVFDNDKSQPLVLFDNSVQPITVIVMLDTSLSMSGSYDFLKEAAEQFMLRLLPNDKARVGAFNDKIQISPRFTNKRDELISEVKNLDYGGGTRLWDAIATSMDELKGIEGRRVVLVLTDGDDAYSKTAKLSTVIERARAEEVMVYAIGMRSPYRDGGRLVTTSPDSGLRKVADETGGGYFELTKATDLLSTFTRVALELHSQYVLGFSPPVLDGKVHKLALKVKQAGMTARARRSYVASALPDSEKP
jgi:VWFA-related protein